MELYDVKRVGFRSPLSSWEISHLFRVGDLHRRVRCKPTGTENWRTIGELFPLLNYGNAAYSIPSDGTSSGRRRALTFAVAAALMTTGAFVYGNRPAGDSIDARPAVPSHRQEVVAATTARVFRLYCSSTGGSIVVRPAENPRRSQAGGVVLARND